MILWRISNHVSLSGDGGLRTSGRWHTRGRRIVYCAMTPAAALLEILVHLEIDLQDLPTRYRLLKIAAPDGIGVERMAAERLSADWPQRTDLTRASGDEWLDRAATALRMVPSAIVPETFNLLLNPAHPDAARLTIMTAGEHALDPRLLRW
ncbi:MAG: RES family NAD+ phosphorylase [Vicinamibacterales bacterium]